MRSKLRRAPGTVAPMLPLSLVALLAAAPAAPGGDPALPAGRWGLTAMGGAGHRFGVSSSDAPGGAKFALALWRNLRPARAVGLEVGSLGGRTRHEDTSFIALTGPPVQEHLVTRLGDHFGYATVDLRWRGLAPAGDGELTAGFGGYANFVSRTDELSVVGNPPAGTTRTVKRHLASWFGANAGGSLAFGRGAVRPLVLARGHWAFAADRAWLVAGIGADFQ